MRRRSRVRRPIHSPPSPLPLPQLPRHLSFVDDDTIVWLSDHTNGTDVLVKCLRWGCQVLHSELFLLCVRVFVCGCLCVYVFICVYMLVWV